MKMFTKSVKKVVNVSLLCSVSYGFILEDFFDKADNLGHLYSQGQLHSRDPFGNPKNLYSRDTFLCQRCPRRRGHLP